MTYVVAAYGITALTLAVYALHLHRENRRLVGEERDRA
jgi:heme exporter protein CcmD